MLTGEELNVFDGFKYLGSAIRSDGRTREDLTRKLHLVVNFIEVLKGWRGKEVFQGELSWEVLHTTNGVLYQKKVRRPTQTDKSQCALYT